VVGAAAASADGLPVAADQPGPLQAMKRRIHGAGRQVERAAAARAQDLDDRVSMLRPSLQDRQQQGIEVAFEQLRSHRQHAPSLQLSTCCRKRHF